MSIKEKLKTMTDKLQPKSGLARVSVTGNYSDLIGAPTKVSQFTNNSNYQTKDGQVTPKNSGVTAGSYGPDGNKTFNITTDGSGNVRNTFSGSTSFSVPYFVVDKTGRITSASNKTITLTTNRTNNYTNYYNYSNYNNYGNYNNYSNYTNYGNYSNSLYASYGAYASYPAYASYQAYASYPSYQNYGNYSNYDNYGNYGSYDNYSNCNCSP